MHEMTGVIRLHLGLLNWLAFVSSSGIKMSTMIGWSASGRVDELYVGRKLLLLLLRIKNGVISDIQTTALFQSNDFFFLGVIFWTTRST